MGEGLSKERPWSPGNKYKLDTSVGLEIFKSTDKVNRKQTRVPCSQSSFVSDTTTQNSLTREVERERHEVKE